MPIDRSMHGDKSLSRSRRWMDTLAQHPASGRNTALAGQGCPAENGTQRTDLVLFGRCTRCLSPDRVL